MPADDLAIEVHNGVANEFTVDSYYEFDVEPKEEDDNDDASNNTSSSDSDDDTNRSRDDNNGSDAGLVTLAESDAGEAKAAEEQLPASTELGTFEATQYTANCSGCSGITSQGLDVRNTIYSPAGLRVIAVDPAVISPMSIVRVTFADGQAFKAVAADVGGAINGKEIDILVADRGKALEFGRQDVSIEIINEGER